MDYRKKKHHIEIEEVSYLHCIRNETGGMMFLAHMYVDSDQYGKEKNMRCCLESFCSHMHVEPVEHNNLSQPG